MELPVWVVFAVIAGLLGSPVAMYGLLLRWLRVFIPASMERSRRRNRKESGAPPIRRRTERDNDDAIPSPWSDSDTTDLHELVEIERQRQRVPRRRPGERPPTRGQHHDR